MCTWVNVHRVSAAERSSEPIIADTTPIARQIIKTFLPIETIDGQHGHRSRLRQPQVGQK